MRIRIITGALVTLTLAACQESDAPPAAEALRPVRVMVVDDGGDNRTRSFTGITQSTQESRMSFRVSGTVIELPVQVGDQLGSGDLLARINPSTYDLTVQQSEAGLAQALANQRNADANYSRVKELYENTNASLNDLDSARAGAESARAQVRSARKSLEIAQLNLSYTELEVASDCTVAAVEVELNENVNSGTTVATVNCGSGIEVSSSVPESLIAGLELGMMARVEFDAVPGRTFEATITELGLAAASSSATFPVVVGVSGTEGAVRPGMAAEVTYEFSSGQSPDTHLIPAAALINDERGSFVYLAQPTANGEATIERRPVTAGELTAGGVEILSGLDSGDRVVTAGISVIREDQRVLLPGA
ncbi:MAG: efflux RND transporter periplasmic adaptor subunit [Pseudomonadota bacterium]